MDEAALEADEGASERGEARWRHVAALGVWVDALVRLVQILLR